MKCRKGLAAVAALLFAVLLSSSIRPLDAREPEIAPRTVVAAQTAKQQCMNSCRARYRDCLHPRQVPTFECQNVYQDCVRFTCTGLGPG
jgi:hypothetical protein